MAKNVHTAVEASKKVVSGSFVLTIGTNTLLAGSIGLIWGFINTLQMIMNLPICEIGFPPNVALLYNIMLPLSSMDIIPPEISTDILFSFSGKDDKPWNDRLDDMGYGNHNAIENIGSVVYFIAFNVLLLMISLLFSIKRYNCCCWTKVMSKLAIGGLLATLYMLFFEGFLEIGISSYLSHIGAVTINSDDKFAYSLSIIFPLVLFTVIPTM